MPGGKEVNISMETLVIIIPAAVIVFTLAGVLAVNISSIIKNEALMIKTIVAISAVILAGVLIGLWQYGIDLSNVFLGTPWNSSLAHTRGIIAIEGGIIAITLLFGGMFLAGIMALITRR